MCCGEEVNTLPSMAGSPYARCSATSSMTCATRRFMPRLRAAVAMCIRQPGLSDATTVQPVLAIASSFQSARRAATCGHSRLNVPPNPEQLAGLALEPELAQRLARVVVGDLEAHLVGAHQVRLVGEQLEGEAGRIAESRPQSVVDLRAPVRGVDREGAEAGRRWGHDQPLGISKALRKLCIQFVGTVEVTGISGDQPAAPLGLGK